MSLYEVDEFVWIRLSTFISHFWTFWIIALHLLYKLWISNILATSITEETCIVEMCIWCKKIGTVNFIWKHKHKFPMPQGRSDLYHINRSKVAKPWGQLTENPNWKFYCQIDNYTTAYLSDDCIPLLSVQSCLWSFFYFTCWMNIFLHSYFSFVFSCIVPVIYFDNGSHQTKLEDKRLWMVS